MRLRLLAIGLGLAITALALAAGTAPSAHAACFEPSLPGPAPGSPGLGPLKPLCLERGDCAALERETFLAEAAQFLRRVQLYAEAARAYAEEAQRYADAAAAFDDCLSREYAVDP